jgi:hypothetical protein
MGAAKESPATQVLEWAVGKFSEASKTDWVEKFSALTASKPAYLKNVTFAASAPSHAPAAAPAPAPAPGGPSQAELDAALSRARTAEAKADSLAQRVAKLEQQLAGRNSHDEVSVSDDEDQKSHWWSRHH